MALSTRLTEPPSGQDTLEVRERYLRKRRTGTFDRRWHVLIIGPIASLSILVTIGVVLLVIGVVLELMGMAGHAVGGRRHYY